MTTYNTRNPLGSAAAKDLFDNAQNLDFAVNDITQTIWTDRFGKVRKTWHGIEISAMVAIKAFGYITMDSFEDGATLTLPNQVLRWKENGEYYRWDGVFPKEVSSGSTPELTGGIGKEFWISVGDASLRASLESESEGSSIIAHMPEGSGAFPRTIQDVLRDNINVLDFVPPTARAVFADGTYSPISAFFASLEEAKQAYPGVTNLELTDSIEYAAIQQADIFARKQRRKLEFCAGKFLITKTIIRKAIWSGQYCTNAWSTDGNDYIWDGTGTVLTPYGAGNPARWTDVDGNDAATYTPMVVSARSGLLIEKMTFRCEASLGVWSTGMFYPGVRRQTLRDFDSMGDWSDVGARGDATWSSLNTTLTALHPDVESDLGLNEYVFDNCFLTGVRSFYIKGTTRDKATTPWVWAPGGTSDFSFNSCRLGNDGDDASRLSYGAGFSHDAVIPNTAGAGQGINFVNCTLRVAGKMVLDLDHTSRVMMVNTYAETTSAWGKAHGAAINSCTSNTSQVSLINDANGQDWYKDGVLVGSSSLVDWALTRIVTKIRADGRIALPNIWGSASSSDPMRLSSRSGTIAFAIDDGTTQAPFAYLNSTTFRGVTANALNLGTSTYPVGVITSQSVIVSTNLRPSASNTVNCGTSSFPWAGGFTQTAFSVISDEREKSRPAMLAKGSLEFDVTSDDKLMQTEYADEILDAWQEVDFLQFQYIDRLLVKGDDGARWHFGVVAQRAKEAFERHGIDPDSFAFFCHDEEKAVEAVYETIPAEYDEEENLIKAEQVLLVSEAYTIPDRYSIRYEEALVLEAALNRRERKKLEDRISALESK